MATISNEYIDFPVTTDSDTLIQNALSSLSSSMPGWTPREGHLEVLALEQMAPIVRESATVASQVTLEIFT